MYKRTKNIIPAGLLMLVLFLSSCNLTRNLPPNTLLLNQNRIRVDNLKIDKTELEAILKQKPNRKYLYFLRFNLVVYNFATIGKERKWKNWMKNTIGEPPVVLDTNLTKKSADQLSLYLQKKGYFNNEVRWDLHRLGEKSKKATIDYHIKTNRPYTIDAINYWISDPEIARFVYGDTVHSLIKKGMNYDENVLELERDHITKNLRDFGYFDFIKEYISYDVDSSLGNNRMQLYIIVKNPTYSDASGKPSEEQNNNLHRRYFINDVFVYPNFTNRTNLSDYRDTLMREGYHFVYSKVLPLKPSVLITPLFVVPGSYFSQQAVDETYRRYTLMRSFRQVAITFKDIPAARDTNWLDAYIRLTPLPKQSVSVSTEGTNSSGNLGISGSLNYQNRNVFHGAEIFDFKIKGGLEVQQISVNTDSTGSGSITNYLPFNTIEFGPEVKLSVPGFLPFHALRFSKRSDPKTTMSMAYNYQARPDYTRTIFNFAYGYSWRATATQQFFIYPMETNFVKVNLTPSFESYLSQVKDVLIRQSYIDLMINSLKGSWIYNNQETGKKKFIYQYLRVNLEQAGWLLGAIVKATGQKKRIDNNGDSTYVVLPTVDRLRQPYAQLVRGDFDYRIYKPFSGFRKLIFRTTFGMGVPYGNSKYLPFIKSFFGGGANDIRGWRARTLGPGAFPKSDVGSFEQIGDVKLQFNLEYRYKIFRSLYGANFIDAGNVWLLKEDSLRQNGHFEFNRFHNEIALAGGMGFRFDFSFFVLRLDLAIPFYDPAYSIYNRWTFRRLGFSDIRGQVGVGYPF